MEQLGRFFALHDLWSACYGIVWHNLRFYYNPVTGLLEPVAYDAEPFWFCDPQQTIISEFVKTKLFADPQVRAAYAHALERVSQADYVPELQSELGSEHDQIRQALEVEFDEDVFVNWAALQTRARNLSLELQPAQPVRGAYQVLDGRQALPESPSWCST